jgi:hypothetical protein
MKEIAGIIAPDPSYQIHIRQSSDQELHVRFWPSPTFSDSIDPTPLNRVVAKLKEFLLQNCTLHQENFIISTDAFLPQKPLTYQEWAKGEQAAPPE